MSSTPTPQEIATNARWLAQALDPPAGLVRLVEMSPEAYRAASFLDDRILTGASAVLVPWAEVSGALPADARRDARWIFHIGHVGSTLVARLLGELDGVLSVREPRLLRDLSFFYQGVRDRFTPEVQALLSRTFAPGETALVKATSMVSEIAPELVAPGGRALFLFATPRAYIEGILAGPNSRQELQMLASARAARMANRVRGMVRAERSDAHRAAAAWACEMTSLEAAAEAMPDRRVIWQDFDRLLGSTPKGLALIADAFGFAAPSDVLERLAAGPLMRRYSKALEYEYSPDLRRQLLREAAAEHASDIEDALAMLDEAARESPLLDRALRRARGEEHHVPHS